MNLNDQVWVKPTEEGIAVFNAWCEDLDLDAASQRLGVTAGEYCVSESDFWVFPLWELMTIFGPEMYNGSSTLFENNEVHFEEKL